MGQPGRKTGRNEPCPCSSGKKYKQCCGREAGVMGLARPGAAGTLALPPDRRAMDSEIANIGRLLSEHEFASIDEANAFLQGLLKGSGGRLPRVAGATAVERAQDLMYQAWEATTARKRLQMAREALKVSPDCADAYLLLAEEAAKSLDEAIGYLEQGVAAGERALGPETFKEDVGHFWGLTETRPYMRARAALAECLWQKGKHQEAMAHLRDLLRLNPGDNQGVRYKLLVWLLETGGDRELRDLFARYPDEGSAAWLYGQALHAFKTKGDMVASRKLLAEAKKHNPHVPAYLLGKKRLPAEPPAYVGWGDANEAVDCVYGQGDTWRSIPGALKWLEWLEK